MNKMSEDEKKKYEEAISIILNGNDIESASYILEKNLNYTIITRGYRINPVSVAIKQILNYIEETKSKGILDIQKELVTEKEKNKDLQNYMKEYLIPKSTINLVYIRKDKIKEIIKKHEEARDLAGEELTTTTIIADTDNLNYGRIETHNVAIEYLKELLEEN